MSLFQRIDFENPLFAGNRLIEFSVRVQDPDPTHADVATVTVNVTDANDNPPLVDPQQMTVNLSEDAAVKTPVFQSFAATDDDLNENAQFQ